MRGPGSDQQLRMSELGLSARLLKPITSRNWSRPTQTWQTASRQGLTLSKLDGRPTSSHNSLTAASHIDEATDQGNKRKFNLDNDLVGKHGM